MMPAVVPLNGAPFVPRLTYIAAATIRQGMLLILDNAGAEAGRVKEFAADDADFASTALEGGFVGVALHAATVGQPVTVSLLTTGMGLAIETYSTAPTAAILGVAVTTLYTLRNDGGVPKVNLGTTTNGVVRFVNREYTDSQPFTTTDRGNTPTETGAAGDRVIITFPEAVRHIK